MSNRDTFCVYLRNLDPDGIKYRVLDDGRHWLDITSDVSLTIYPDADDMPAVVAALRKLAAAASEMAGELDKLAACAVCGHRSHPETSTECQSCPEGYCERRLTDGEYAELQAEHLAAADLDPRWPADDS